MTRLRLALVLLLALLPACEGAVVDREPVATVTTTSAAVAALDEIRTDVGPAAVALATATGRLEAAVATLRDDVAGVVVVREEVAAVRGAADALAAAGGRAGAFPDVVAASDGVADAARSMAEAASDAAEGIAVGERRRVQLTELVEKWDDDASRREQLERLAVVEADLRSLAGATPAAPPGCARPEADWLAAAGVAADLTTMLLDAVRDTDGLRFDELRSDGRDASGVDRPVESSAATCPALGLVDERAELVANGLDEVEESLNPTDLVRG